MINFNSETRSFHLHNNNISYIFYINSKNILQHIYFGKRVKDFDFESYINLGWEWSKTYLGPDLVEHSYEDNYFNDRSLMEIAQHGGHDKRGAPIIIKDLLGNTKTNLKYVSHKIYKGKPTLSELPSTHAKDDEVETVEIVLKDELKAVEVVLSYSIFATVDVIARNTTIKNLGKENIIVSRAYSLQLDIPEKEFQAVYFHGDWCTERFLKKVDLPYGKFAISSNNGRSGHEHNPFMMLSRKNTTESTGEVYGFSFVYSGNFTIEANVDKWNCTRVFAGINEEDFEFTLKENETFVVPEGLLVYSNEGYNKLSHSMHDLVRDHLITYKDAKLKRPVLFNSWEGCYLDFNTQVILDYIDNAKSIGSELFVLDDGWFSNDRDTDDRGLGDWFVNEKKVDLNKVIKKCKDNGIKFGIWFEPEMINHDSELYRNHPNFALGNPNIERSLSRHQMVVDTSNDEAIDVIYNQMIKVIDAYDIDYIKWDHNRCIAEINSSSNYQETYHKIILGYYKLIRRLQERYPHILFEGCASGGGRFDLGALYFTPQIWTSDETDPIQRIFIQYGTSFAYPLSTMGSHVSKSKMTGYEAKSHIALFGTYGYEMNPCLLNDKEREEILKVTDVYHKYHNEVIQNGDLYRLLSPFETNYMSMMSVSKDKSKAIVLFANLFKERNMYRYLKLQGLDPNKNYTNNYDNKVHSGEYYMELGLNLTRWFEEFKTLLIILEEVK